MFTCKAGYGFQAGESSRIIVRIHDRLELRNKDIKTETCLSLNLDQSIVTVGRAQQVPGPSFTNRVHVESGPG